MPTSTIGDHELGLRPNRLEARSSRARPPTTARRSSIRSVLVATDFSKGAAMAIERVRYLPLDPAARVTLVHVPDPGARGTPAEADAEKRLDREAEHLRKALTRGGGKGVAVRAKLTPGRAFEVIAGEGARTDLVVVGRHGAGKFIDMLLGSTAERLLRIAVAPVLIVGEEDVQPYRHPMVGIDMSPASRRALEFCLRLLPDARVLEIDHAFQPMFESPLRRAGYAERDIRKNHREERAEASKQLGRFLDAVEGGVGGPCRSHVRAGDPRFVLLDRAKRRRADLIVVGTRGRSGVARWILGSVAEAVVRNATCDVLVVPGRSRNGLQ